MEKKKPASLKEILKSEYSQTISDLDLQEAEINLSGFFQTLIEICEENNIQIDVSTFQNQELKYKN